MKPFAILITIATLAGAQQRFDMVVRSDFFAGFTGDKEALERGMKAAAAVLEKDPNHAEALVWHGAGTYFLSGQSFQAGDRETGMELFGKALPRWTRPWKSHRETSASESRAALLSCRVRCSCRRMLPSRWS